MKYFTCIFMIICSLLLADDYEIGVELLRNKQYEEASKHFKLAAQSPEKAKAATFGRVLCDVALGKYEKIEKRMSLVNDISFCNSCDSSQESKSPPTTSAEQFAAYECRQHVRKIAQDLRNLVERMIAETVPGVIQKIKTFRQLNPYIDNLERNGISCCQKGQTSNSCVEPLVRQLELWNSEGLPIKSKINK